MTTFAYLVLATLALGAGLLAGLLLLSRYMDRDWRALRQWEREDQCRRKRLGMESQQIATQDRRAWQELSHQSPHRSQTS